MYEYTIEIIFKWSTVHVVACWYLPFFWKLVMILHTAVDDQHLLDVSNLRSYYIYHTCITFLNLLNYDLYM